MVSRTGLKLIFSEKDQVTNSVDKVHFWKAFDLVPYSIRTEKPVQQKVNIGHVKNWLTARSQTTNKETSLSRCISSRVLKETGS